MHYYGMNTEEINSHSRKFLYALYSRYPNRAAENLGVSLKDKDGEDNELTDKDYPSQYKRFTQEERDKYIEESNMTDDEFLAQFPEFEKH